MGEQSIGGNTGSALGSITSGGFSFDEATMQRIITRYTTTLADSYHASLPNADMMAAVTGPGLDYASQSVASAANKGGSSYYQYLIRQRDACRTQAALFQQAHNEYLGVDQVAVAHIDEADDRGGREGSEGIL